MEGGDEGRTVDAISFSISMTSKLLLKSRGGLKAQRQQLESRLRMMLRYWRHGPLHDAFKRLHAHAQTEARRMMSRGLQVTALVSITDGLAAEITKNRTLHEPFCHPVPPYLAGPSLFCNVSCEGSTRAAAW